MSLKSAVKRLEKIQLLKEEIIFIVYLPDFDESNYIIVKQSGKEDERITREEHRRRIAKAKANGEVIYSIT